MGHVRPVDLHRAVDALVNSPSMEQAEDLGRLAREYVLPVSAEVHRLGAEAAESALEGGGGGGGGCSGSDGSARG